MSGYEREDHIRGTQVNPVARTSDPHTSHDAADSIPSPEIRVRQKAVLTILERGGPRTDEEIFAIYAGVEGTSNVFPPQSPSGLRTRRCELVRAGYVTDTGDRRELRSGRMAIVWAASDPRVRQPVDLFPSVPAAEHNQLTL